MGPIKQWLGGRKYSLTAEQIAEISELVDNARRNENAETIALAYIKENGIEPIAAPVDPTVIPDNSNEGEPEKTRRRRR